MKRSLVLGVILSVGAASIGVAANRQASQVIEVEKVRDNLYLLTSSSPADRATFSGGNVAVFITDSGVALVDTKLAAWGQTLLDRIKSVTNKPVTTIINTHTHGDHTGNNDKFGPNVDSIVHENTKANMAKMDAFKGDNAKFLPERTYTDKTSVGSGHPVTTWKDLQEFQRFTSDLLNESRAAMKAGKSVDDAAASIANLTSKYPGYKSERVKAAVQAIYDEAK